jgi:hypothetical protein
VPIFLRSDSASSNMIQLFFFSLVLAFLIHLYSPVTIFTCWSMYFSAYLHLPRHYRY